ncbi:uncharacterized protein LOC125256318 isoform X3 [Megalobrama amblycephala]|uniref:uncharacterized protein LOC125256318 isoform X3 n=1 Tax=Megalobrama amblycephala TaxID=75352 RepID=UPI00201434D8|nr:uncharacterized protein LOC125256318 isoform X3 [Megalobrama amblycephala]
MMFSLQFQQRPHKKTSQRDTKILMAAVSTTETPESTRTDLKHPDSHQDNTPDPTATSSFIMAENSIYQPSAVMAAVSTTKTPESTRTDVQKTNTSTTPPHPQKVTWFIVLVFTGVGVILTGFICLGCFACIKGRQHNKMRSIRSDVPSQGIGMSSAEIYSLITSEPVTSQPISVGLEHPDSHQDNTPDPTATSSFIMAENSMYQPSDVLVNKQQKEGNMENENVYHLYCTIPDRPVHSNAADQVYSLVN